MPRSLFGRKNKSPSNENFQNAVKTSSETTTRPNDAAAPTTDGSAKDGRATQPSMPTQPQRPRLVFHCQQAHGSPTGIIAGFTNVKELYQKIADCYDLPVEEVSRRVPGWTQFCSNCCWEAKISVCLVHVWLVDVFLVILKYPHMFV